MASREEIESLRQLARKRHRAATAKVSRLKTKHDIDVPAHGLDPRRNVADINTMRTRDLNAYIRKLDSFNSRETAFVKGAGQKKLLNKNLYNQFEKLKNQVNAKRAAPYESIKDIRIPSLGDTTVEGFMGQKPTHPITQNPSSRAPHLPVTTTNKGIPNDKQLKKLIKNLETQLSSDYGNKVIARDQKVIGKFFKDMGKVSKDEDLKILRKAYKDLTPAQFAFLWNYTNFAETASMDYEIAKDHMQDNKVLAEKSDSFKTQLRHMQNLITDVKQLKF